MQLYKPFQFLNDAECNELIQYAKDNRLVPGKTAKDKKRKIRNNRIVWYRDAQHWPRWIEMFNNIEPVIDWLQTPQISFYQPGEYYDWHVDTWPADRTHIRHFTLTCELQSAPDSQLHLQNHSFTPLKKGQAIIFLPGDRHKVSTPSDGERISFTIWAMAKNLNKITKH